MCYIVLSVAISGLRAASGALAEVHLVVGVAVMALNLVAGLWGARRGREPAVGVVLVRAARGPDRRWSCRCCSARCCWSPAARPIDAIHYMYGTAPLLVNLFAEGMRVGAAQREVPEDVEFERLPAASSARSRCGSCAARWGS